MNDKDGLTESSPGDYQQAEALQHNSFKDMMNDVVEAGSCCECGSCVLVCPHNVIDYINNKPKQVAKETNAFDFCGISEGVGCDVCASVCPRLWPREDHLKDAVFKDKRPYEDIFGVYRNIFVARTKREELKERIQDGGIVTALLAWAVEQGEIDGFYYFAMEYVEGESVAAMIERIGTVGMLDWRDAFRVCVHIARALNEAFEHKIIHRNITPENILVRSEDKVAKLGDMMLAKALEGTKVEQITQPGQLIGPIPFMPPERTLGSSDVDCRADIYSLGATVYALLTGRPPIEGGNLPELIMKIRDETPQRPKDFQLSIDDMFEGVVMRMLEKRPEERFQEPADLVKELERIAQFQNLET